MTGRLYNEYFIYVEFQTVQWYIPDLNLVVIQLYCKPDKVAVIQLQGIGNLNNPLRSEVPMVVAMKTTEYYILVGHIMK